MNIYLYIKISVSLLLSLSIVGTNSREKEIEIKLYDIYSKKPYLDSLYFVGETFLQSCDDKQGRWLLPDKLGIYKVKSACNGFHIKTNKEDYSEIMYVGLWKYEELKIQIDFFSVFPYQGVDTTLVTRMTRKGWFGKISKKKYNIERDTIITSFGENGWTASEIPKKITFRINGNSENLFLQNIGNTQMRGQGRNDSEKKFYIHENRIALRVLYTNEW